MKSIKRSKRGRRGECLLFALFATLLLFSPSSPTWADTPKGGGLSQLEFDHPVAVGIPSANVTTPTDHDIQVILEGTKATPVPKPTMVVPVATPISQPAGNTSSGTATIVKGTIALKDGKVQEFDWVKPSDGQGHFLIPRLRGPKGDPGHDTSISTEAKWSKQNGACEVNKVDLLCEKARSLKELLFRFSGDPDFYVRQCQQACDDPSTQSMLTAFRVKDRRGQSFDILMVGDKCRYTMGATSGRVPWLAMEGEGGSCKCLPRGCAD